MLQPVIDFLDQFLIASQNLFQCIRSLARALSANRRYLGEHTPSLLFERKKRFPFLRPACFKHHPTDIQNCLVLDTWATGHDHETDLPGAISDHAE